MQFQLLLRYSARKAARLSIPASDSDTFAMKFSSTKDGACLEIPVEVWINEGAGCAGGSDVQFRIQTFRNVFWFKPIRT